MYKSGWATREHMTLKITNVVNVIVAYKVFATEGYVCDVCVPEWVGYKGTYDFKEKI